MFKHLTQSEYEADLLTQWTSNYICDYLISKILSTNEEQPNLIMGYSMGLITGATYGEAIDLEDGIELLRSIINYREMQNEEDMATVIGLEEDEINLVIQEHGCEEQVYVACKNNDACFGISGIKGAIQELIPYLYDRGAIKVKYIDSILAFHTPFMRDNIKQLENDISKIKFRDLKIPIYTVNSQKTIFTAKEVRDEMLKNMYSVILWNKGIQTNSSNIDAFVDIGLTKGLYKLSKGICYDKTFLNVDKFSCFRPTN